MAKLKVKLVAGPVGSVETSRNVVERANGFPVATAVLPGEPVIAQRATLIFPVIALVSFSISETLEICQDAASVKVSPGPGLEDPDAIPPNVFAVPLPNRAIWLNELKLSSVVGVDGFALSSILFPLFRSEKRQL